MALKKGGLSFGYHDHYVVDGGKARIILEVLVTPADVMENQPFLDMLWRACFRWRIRPDQVTGDTTYGTVENIVEVQDQKIYAYVPLSDFDQRTPFYGASHFTYDSDRDEYRCPEGQVLRRRTAKYTEGVVVYRAEAATCQACPLKAACTEGSQGRQVQRSLYAEYLERVHAYHQTAAYEKAMAKRKVWVEPLFGEAKDWHGLSRSGFADSGRSRRGARGRGWPEPEATAPKGWLGAAARAGWGAGGAVRPPTTAPATPRVAFPCLSIA